MERLPPSELNARPPMWPIRAIIGGLAPSCGDGSPFQNGDERRDSDLGAELARKGSAEFCAPTWPGCPLPMAPCPRIDTVPEGGLSGSMIGESKLASVTAEDGGDVRSPLALALSRAM